MGVEYRYSITYRSYIHFPSRTETSFPGRWAALPEQDATATCTQTITLSSDYCLASFRKS